ncbi:DUF5996 family protein [Frateuria sp. GZRR35]|uniref:DUF5996 family protein n=1 Tax=unclassified Frateuria TaxID=2648894 RepID=UPI003EDC5195
MPQPGGLDQAAVQPEAAYFDPSLSEFILPYEAVRAFMQSTWQQAAKLGRWDLAGLERR